MSCEAETTKESIKTKTERRTCFCICVVYITLIVHKFGIQRINKVGNRLAKLNEKKSDRDLEQKISAGEKRRNANGHQGENERMKKSEQQQVRDFLHKMCN